MAGDFLLFDSPPLLPELIPSSPPPLSSKSRQTAASTASTASGSDSSHFAYSPLLLPRTERSASVPTQEFNRIPIRKRTNEFRTSSNIGYDSSSWSNPDGAFSASNDGDIIFDRQSSAYNGAPQDAGDDETGYWIPPHSDHPLSVREQSDLLDRVREDLLGVDLSALKGPLKALALSKNNAYGMESSGPHPLSPTLLPIDDSFVGYGRPIPPNQPPTRLVNPQSTRGDSSSLSTLRNTPTNPNQLSPTLIGMRKRAAQESSDLSMRRTVSPQEAFLDYEDVEEKYHLGQSGTSLFAPLPSPFRSTPAPLPTTTSSPSASTSTTAPIAIGKMKSSPSTGVKSSATLPQASPPSRTTHRPVHPFSVPQNAVNWADGGAREDESDDDDDRMEDRRAGAGKTGPGESVRSSKDGGIPRRAGAEGQMEVDRVFSPVQSTLEFGTTSQSNILPPSVPAPIPIIEDDEPYLPPTFVTTATSFAQRRSAAPPSPLPPAPLQFPSTSRDYVVPPVASTTALRRSATPSLATSTSGSASRSVSREIQSNPFGDEEQGEDPVHIVDPVTDSLAAPPLQPTPSSLPRKRSRRPATPEQPTEEAERPVQEEEEEEEEVAVTTRQSSTPRARKKSRRTASEDEFDETLNAQEEGDDDNDSNFSEASSLSPAPVTVRRPRTVISSRDFGNTDAEPTTDSSQSTPQPSAPKKRRANTNGRASSTGTIKCPFVNSTGQICNVPFRRPYDLARHRETIHFEGGNGKRVEWICERCKGAFSRKDALTRHGRVCKK